MLTMLKTAWEKYLARKVFNFFVEFLIVIVTAMSINVLIGGINILKEGVTDFDSFRIGFMGVYFSYLVGIPLLFKNLAKRFNAVKQFKENCLWYEARIFLITMGIAIMVSIIFMVVTFVGVYYDVNQTIVGIIFIIIDCITIVLSGANIIFMHLN